MPRPKNEKMQGTPPPSSFEPLIGVRYPIPMSDRTSVGTQPVFRISTNPPCWLPDTEWARRWLEA